MRKNESLFFALSEFSPAGIYLTNKDGDCLYSNRQWQKMAGLSAEEAIGEGWKKALHPDDIKEIFSKWNKVVETQGEWNFEYRFVNQETEEITWVLGLAKPLYDEKGILKGYIGLNIDITKDKLKNEEIRNQLHEELEYAHSQLERLQGILPICASCKKIRDSNSNWKEIDQYIVENTNADLSHGICPDCLQKLYPGYYNKKRE